MKKEYDGRVAGRSVTLFTAAFEQSTGTGTYIAMESFAGALNGQTGAFNFAHSATTLGGGRECEFFVIVPASGTGALAGVTGTDGVAVDAEGTHRIWPDYELGQ